MIGKYPRTFNLPWSGSDSSDDVWWENCKLFEGKEVVVTEKQDGECTGMNRELCHARSLDSQHHVSRSWVKSLHGGIRHMIPEGWKIFGENMFAWHSVFYTDLPGYFLVFGAYDHKNMCSSWDDLVHICEQIGLSTVPVLYRGVWDEKKIREMWTGKGHYPTFASKVDGTPVYPEDFESCEAEGYVVRLADSFRYEDFRNSCAKYVRPHHVQTDSFWMSRPVVRNLLHE